MPSPHRTTQRSCLLVFEICRPRLQEDRGPAAPRRKSLAGARRQRVSHDRKRLSKRLRRGDPVHRSCPSVRCTCAARRIQPSPLFTSAHRRPRQCLLAVKRQERRGPSQTGCRLRAAFLFGVAHGEPPRLCQTLDRLGAPRGHAGCQGRATWPPSRTLSVPKPHSQARKQRAQHDGH